MYMNVPHSLIRNANFLYAARNGSKARACGRIIVVIAGHGAQVLDSGTTDRSARWITDPIKDKRDHM